MRSNTRHNAPFAITLELVIIGSRSTLNARINAIISLLKCRYVSYIGSITKIAPPSIAAVAKRASTNATLNALNVAKSGRCP